MESKEETPEGGGWKIPLDPAPGPSAEGKELEWFLWIRGPGAAAVGLSPHFPWDDPPRSHPSRGSHRDALGSPGAFPWQFLSGWMGLCARGWELGRSWHRGGSSTSRGIPREARTPWNWEFPFSSQRSWIWMDSLPFFPFVALSGEPGVGICPSRPWEAALSLHYSPFP